MCNTKKRKDETAEELKKNENGKKETPAKPKEKHGETTTTYNDTTIADLGKLTALTSRGEYMQFSLGEKTNVSSGDHADIVNGELTLDCPFLGVPQFTITRKSKSRSNKWFIQVHNGKNKTFLNGKELENLKETELPNHSLIRVTEGTRSQVFVFEDTYDEFVEWRSYILRKNSKPITIYSSEALRQFSSSKTTQNHEKLPHAVFVNSNGSWKVIDVNINRGISVNGERMKENEKEKVIRPYDVICIGSTTFIYLPGRLIYNLASGFRKSLIINIEERSVNISWNKKKVLLKDISLTIEPGQLVLLLGGSGSGKTTFINAVTGYEPATAKVLNGGVDVYENYNQMKYEIGVVPQEDLLRGMDTVYMTLMNSATLRLPADYTRNQLRRRVDEVLEDFGLAHHKDSLVKELSGGQRKRLSIACEYIGDPSLFILDEPDSGLDGVIARELMERLRRIADSGKIVLVITHTPDRVIDLFDHIIVLAKDSSKVGRLAYYGTIDGAKKFFGKNNMEDIVKAVNTPEEGGEGRADELIARFEAMRKEEEA